MATTHEALRALGLTEYGARAYAALVALGASGAAAVASAGPVPRTKVYAVLADLARRGWVEAEGGRPRRYRALPPRECFARERARLDALAEAALPALEAQMRDRATRFGGPLWILDGADLVAARALEMIARAKRDVLLVASFPLPGDERETPRALKAAIRRGAQVRLVAPDLGAPHARALAVPGAQVRQGLVPPRVLFCDGREGLVVAPPTKDAPVRGIYNPAPDLVKLMGGAMAAFWDGWGEAPVTRPRMIRNRQRRL
ncbi:MAG: HTH-type transcriptional regulator, sugar sensing transcriptional regulator [Thermoplasmata archaeon]|jgi:sugar-specific transcriptional regulator TrmB|nr:HTH-type transcriptional regulator, sugar sensing transcriptional regulator [Thermoplasmata archaeon]